MVKGTVCCEIPPYKAYACIFREMGSIEPLVSKNIKSSLGVKMQNFEVHGKHCIIMLLNVPKAPEWGWVHHPKCLVSGCTPKFFVIVYTSFMLGVPACFPETP